MMHDVLTMIWKEWREIFFQRGLRRTEVFGRYTLGIAIFVLLVWRAGPMIASSPAAFLFPNLIMFQLLVAMVADSFAGERERHTLETLLATRLSDTAILVGKIASAVLLMWGLVVVALGIGFIGNWVIGGTNMPANVLVRLLVFDLLIAMLVGSGGVLVSLRASSVRQAVQIMGFAFMLFFFGVIYLARSLSPAWRVILLRNLAGENLWRTEIAAAAILIAFNAGLFAMARMRFRRARLLLD